MPRPEVCQRRIRLQSHHSAGKIHCNGCGDIRHGVALAGNIVTLPQLVIHPSVERIGQRITALFSRLNWLNQTHLRDNGAVDPGGTNLGHQLQFDLPMGHLDLGNFQRAIAK